MTTRPATAAKVARAVAMRRSGRSLQDIGDALGVSRERARQLLIAGGGDPLPGRRGRTALTARGRVIKERLPAAVERWIVRGPSLTVVAKEHGVPVRALRPAAIAALGRDGFRAIGNARKGRERLRDEAILGSLRSVAGGRPLSIERYRAAGAAPSYATAAARFGSWRGACEAAGIACGGPGRGGYRRITAGECLDAAAEVARDLGHVPSLGEYEAARRRRALPSASLVRLRVGGWTAVRAAVHTLLSEEVPA